MDNEPTSIAQLIPDDIEQYRLPDPSIPDEDSSESVLGRHRFLEVAHHAVHKLVASRQVRRSAAESRVEGATARDGVRGGFSFHKFL